MDFLHEQPVVSLVGPGQAQTFIAEVFQARPSVDKFAQLSQESAEAAKKIRQVMDRKNCAVTWVQLVIDQHGVLVEESGDISACALRKSWVGSDASSYVRRCVCSWL